MNGDQTLNDSPLRGKIFTVTALGCRTNLYEAEAVIRALEASGAIWRRGRGEAAEIVVVMTCAVTASADAKTRKAIRRLRRACPGAALAVCGCWAQLCGADEAASLGADILVGSRKKHEIVRALSEWFAAPRFSRVVDDRVSACRDWDELSIDRPRAHTRAFIKVQDGCSRRCSYCAVPAARGAQTSREPEDAIKEILRVASSGCREIILTGIRLGGYDYRGIRLGGLIRAITNAGFSGRLRLGSLEPFSLGGELLSALAECPSFCPHLHLPLQSGDDTVLGAMRRGYTARDFALAADAARAALGDDLHISTDLITGFPGEDEAAFRRSLDLISSLGLGRVHVFPFSPRAGTEAASMDGEVPPAERRERAARAIALGRETLARYASRFAGRECEPLIEREDGGTAAGWTRHYLRAVCLSSEGGEKFEKNLIGNVIKFTPKRAIGGILLGNGVEPAGAARFDEPA